CKFRNRRNIMPRIKSVVVGSTAPMSFVKLTSGSYHTTSPRIAEEVTIHKIEYSTFSFFLLAKSITMMKKSTAIEIAKIFCVNGISSRFSKHHDQHRKGHFQSVITNGEPLMHPKLIFGRMHLDGTFENPHFVPVHQDQNVQIGIIEWIIIL